MSKRQIPCLFGQRLASGETAWHWKPSPRLRRAGFTNRSLGKDQRLAAAAAIDLNEQVAVWERANAGDATAAPRQRAPRIVRFDELVLRYKASPDYRDLAKASRKQYDVRLRQLEGWALDGSLAVRDIDVHLVRRLREGLQNGSRYKLASVLRVLRLLLAFAEREGIIPKNSNPATNVDIPSPPIRLMRMNGAVRDAIIAAAGALGLHEVVFAIPLGLWSLQRQADMLALNRLAWRSIATGDADPRHVAQLVDRDGRVLGFRLQQNKTGAWIDAPLPPHLHADIVGRWRTTKSDWLFPDPRDASRPMSSDLFQAHFRAAQRAAVAVAIMDGEMLLAEAIDACQFRDLRRTGMIFFKDAGARAEWITALSGHYVLGRKTIIDNYMPGDTAGAIACVATGVRAMKERDERASKTAD